MNIFRFNILIWFTHYYLIPQIKFLPLDCHLDVGGLCHPHEVECEHLQSLEGECVPSTGDEGVAYISDPVHGEGQDEHVDDSNLLQDPIWVEEEGNGDQGAGGDGQSQQVDWGIQIFLQNVSLDREEIIEFALLYVTLRNTNKKVST